MSGGLRDEPVRWRPVSTDTAAAWMERGYSPPTAPHSLTGLGHLGRWMDRDAIKPSQLDDAAARAFVGSQPWTRTGRVPLSSLRPLRDYLRPEGDWSHLSRAAGEASGGS